MLKQVPHAAIRHARVHTLAFPILSFLSMHFNANWIPKDECRWTRDVNSFLHADRSVNMHDCQQPVEDGIKPAWDGRVVWVLVLTYSRVQMSENTLKMWDSVVFLETEE